MSVQAESDNGPSINISEQSVMQVVHLYFSSKQSGKLLWTRIKNIEMQQDVGIADQQKA